MIVESLRALVGYTYDLHVWRLLAIAALTWAINALLLAFVTARFPLVGRRRFLVVCHVRRARLRAQGFEGTVGVRPVPGAIVIVRRADDRQQIATARTDADGAFRLRGLPEGDVAASALDGRETSDWAFVRLHDGDEASDVRLEVASRRVVRGQLRHRGAPVIGAEIDYRVGDPTFLAHPARATTDLEGRFELSVPLGTTRVGVLVTTPSPAIHVGRLDWSFGSPDTVGPVELAPWDLPETLALRLPIDRSILEGADSRWILVDGVPIEASILTNLGLRLGTLSTRDDAFWIGGLGLAEYQVCASRQGPCRPARTRVDGAPVGDPVVAGSQ